MAVRVTQRIVILLALFFTVFFVGVYRNHIHKIMRRNIQTSLIKNVNAPGLDAEEPERRPSHGFHNRSSTTAKKIQPVLILFWSKYFGSPVVCDQPIPRSKICNNTNLKHCGTPCEITANRSRADNASIMIINARDPHPLPPTKYNSTPLVLFTWENPVYTPMLSDAKFVSKFNYLMSYRPDVADFFLPTMDTPTIEPKPIPFVNKTALIAAVFSNCEPVRTAYLEELMKHIPIDSYGKCLRNKNGLSERYEEDFKRKKVLLLRRYKFTIVFHNQDCDYFIDDQLTHALNAGTIPIFMGSDKVDGLLGGNLNQSIIKVKDFSSPKQLADFIKVVARNETLYNSYLKWKYHGFQFSKSFLDTPQGQGIQFLHHPQYCKVCETIAAARITGGFKKKGSVQPEYCRTRKREDWLPKPVVDKKLR